MALDRRCGCAKQTFYRLRPSLRPSTNSPEPSKPSPAAIAITGRANAVPTAATPILPMTAVVTAPSAAPPTVAEAMRVASFEGLALVGFGPCSMNISGEADRG